MKRMIFPLKAISITFQETLTSKYKNLEVTAHGGIMNFHIFPKVIFITFFRYRSLNFMKAF